MPRTSDFYSVNEAYRSVEERVYHNNSSCPSGCRIREVGEDRPGTDGYHLCRDCDARNGPER
jgi:hypothetical protein